MRNRVVGLVINATCLLILGGRLASATDVQPVLDSSRAATPSRSPALPRTSEAIPKRIYIANDDHTDYMWTATDSQYRTAFLSMLDYYMAQAENTAFNPEDARGRFNCDASLWVWEYEHNRSAADFQRLVSHLRNRTITMPLQSCVTVPGAMPAEAVLRDMYYAGRLERREGLRFPLVEAMENQTLPGGVASLWAGAGALYSWRGICGCATRINAGQRPREIYHFAGPDGQSVCMKWNTYNGAGSIGGYAEASDIGSAVNYLDLDPGHNARWPWPVSAAFGYGGDHLQTTHTGFVDAALNLSNADRRVIVSNEIDFFEDFLANHSAEIPTFSGSFGNEWDLYTASMGELTADFKRHVEKLRGAEALATVASLGVPGFMNGRETERDSAFLACGLYYEHDWTADGPVSPTARAQYQRERLRDLTRYVDRLHDDARAAVAGLIANPAGVERHMVFNPLSWARTDVADLELASPTPVHVVEVASGLEVPSQIVTVGGAQRLRIVATDVPSVGYKVYEVRPGAGAAFPASASVSLPSVDHEFYRVTLGSRGSIVSLIDHKDADRQLVDGSLHDFGSGSGSVTVEATGPVSTTLRVLASDNPDHEIHVTVHRGIDRVDIEGLVTENFMGDESYNSKFALAGAVMRHEEVGMIARVARLSQGGSYADQNTRTDYLTFNHFVDLSLPTRGVTVSNWDSPFFAAGNSTVNFLDSSPIVRAVIGMQVDGPGLGIHKQGDMTRFLDRFSLRTHGVYDPSAAMRFALEHQNPLIAAVVTGATADLLPADQWSLVAMPSPDVLLWAIKPAEEGIEHGIIARVWNLAEGPRTLELSLPGRPIATADATTHIETDLAPLSVDNGTLLDPLASQQMKTYRLRGASVLGVPSAAIASPLRLAAFPNPAGIESRTRIAYTLPVEGHVRLSVHDVRGRRIGTLVNRVESAGPHTLEWNGRELDGTRAGPGLYFLRLESGGHAATRKLVRI